MPTQQFAASRGNTILSALSADVRARLDRHLEVVHLPLASRLYNPYEPIDYIYFPIGAIASIIATTSEGQSTEIGLVGREGALGIETLLGAVAVPHTCAIQLPDSGYRITVKAALEEFRRGGEFQDQVFKFYRKLTMQISQTTLCNRVHNARNRLSRWLLMCRDRVDVDVLDVTQEFIAVMLGTSRVTVTQNPRQLQAEGIIRYSRGRITILDLDRLKDSACECYEIVRREYEG